MLLLTWLRLIALLKPEAICSKNPLSALFAPVADEELLLESSLPPPCRLPAFPLESTSACYRTLFFSSR